MAGIKDQMKMVRELQKAQKELKKEIIEVEAGEGAVVIQFTGELKVKSVKLNPELIDFEDTEELEHWIQIAIRDGLEDFIPDEEKDLGDLFINIDYARKQAREYGHSEKRELGFLFTHGLLHCLGYDHMNPEDEKKMFALQDRILDPIISRNDK